MDLNTMLAVVDGWPVEDRVQLVQEVWDRLAGRGHEPRISDEMKAELERRLDAHRADPDAAIAWEQVEAEALARLRR